jgi:hypothetical protein
MPYNLTGIASNSTNIVLLMQGVNNTLMFGWLFNLILGGMFLVMTGAFYFSTQDWPRSFAAAAFLTFIFSIFFRALSLVPDMAVYIALLAAGLAVALGWKNV